MEDEESKVAHPPEPHILDAGDYSFSSSEKSLNRINIDTGSYNTITSRSVSEGDVDVQKRTMEYNTTRMARPEIEWGKPEKPVSAAMMFFKKVFEGVQKRSLNQAFGSIKRNKEFSKKYQRVNSSLSKYMLRSGITAMKTYSKQVMALNKLLTKINEKADKHLTSK